MLSAALAPQSSRSTRSSVVLVGLESVGKSALFRQLTGQPAEEANYRGSTVICQQAQAAGSNETIIDVPGIRLDSDAVTTRLALEQFGTADTLLLVIRATNAAEELEQLLRLVKPEGRRTTIAVTFEDLVSSPADLARYVQLCGDILGVPVVSLNARQITENQRAALFLALQEARPLRRTEQIARLPRLLQDVPAATLFEHPLWGRLLSLLAVMLVFAVPVYAAYLLSSLLQPYADLALIDPLRASLEGAPELLAALLVGDYGLLSLGIYSFLWAFPVVVLLSISVSLTEESGLKDRITGSLDGWLRRIGLSGRDLIPVLGGFGCNVVAVFQSRSCSACTRRSCVSMIAFGSACSYQIGASLSLFGASGAPWLFIPYILTLFAAGALHTRLWHGANRHAPVSSLTDRSFLQAPSLRVVYGRAQSVIRQFLLQAMPIFLVICLVAALLQLSGGLDQLAAVLGPAMEWIGIPAAASAAVLFSILRKDGLLVLNQGEGELLHAMSAAQTFVLVYLASTLSACLVTLWTIRKELGLRDAAKLGGRQALTSLVSTGLLAWLLL